MEFKCHGVRGSRPVSVKKEDISHIVSDYLLVSSQGEKEEFLQSKPKTKSWAESKFFNQEITNKLSKINKSYLGLANNTPCVEVRDKSLKNEQLIFDLGTGASHIDISDETETLHIFFTHFHYDHVQGMLFFNALYDKKINVHFYSPVKGFQRYLEELMHHPYFPVTMSESMTSKIYFHELDKKQNQKLGDLKITWKSINHPGGCYAYRVENKDAVFCYFTDVNINDALFNLSKDNETFLSNIDAMILDASMSFEDSVTKKYYGHSNFYRGIDFANFWNVKKVFLFHLDPVDNIKTIPALYQSALWYKKLISPKMKLDLAEEEKWVKI